MHRILNAYALPELVQPDEMAGAAAVVIDVLRASTTIIHALAAGADAVRPCLEVDEARVLAGELAGQQAILAGERNGLAVAGFDLGNSPDEFTPERVANRPVVFTTTNGTRAMARCRHAARVFVGAFVNAAALGDVLAQHEEIHLVCSGTRGAATEEDLLLAGLLVARLQHRAPATYVLNARAVACRDEWTANFPTFFEDGAGPHDENLAAVLRGSLGGRNLLTVGLDEDIRTAARLDRFAMVPELDTGSMQIRPG